MKKERPSVWLIGLLLSFAFYNNVGEASTIQSLRNPNVWSVCNQMNLVSAGSVYAEVIFVDYASITCAEFPLRPDLVGGVGGAKKV